MPLLDPSDVLLDPDFWDTLICTRSTQTVDETGVASVAQTTKTFRGVVTSDRGLIMERMAAGEYVVGSISVVSRFLLRDNGAGVTADIVTWNNKQYTVVRVNDYSRYGLGFTQAICELLPLAG